MLLRSTSPFVFSGVSTVMKIILENVTACSGFVVNVKRPDLILEMISLSKPGSWIGELPFSSCAIRWVFLSMQQTSWPVSARQAA